MPIYSVSYNMKGDVIKKKNSISQRIRSHCDESVEYIENAWIVSYTGNADDLSTNLRKSLDENDNILIIKVINSCQGWLPEEYWDKINSMLRQG